MNREAFAAVLDRSWAGFRQQLLDIYPVYSGVPSPKLEFAELSYLTSNPASPASVASVLKDCSVISFPTSLQSVGGTPMISAKSGRSCDAENSDQAGVSDKVGSYIILDYTIL